MFDKKISTILATIIIVVWCISFIADLLIPTYDAPISVGSAMMLVAGAAFANGVLGKKEN